MRKVDDIPFYFIGFKSATPKFTLKTHIWALLHTHILYRTVSGMMNYSRAIKLLFCVDNPEVVQQFGSNTDKLERELKQNGEAQIQVCCFDAMVLQVQQGGAWEC